MPPSPDPGWRRRFRPAFGLALLIALPLLGLRLAPLAAPYAGQAALDGQRFSLRVLDGEGGELQVLPLEGGLRRCFVPLAELPPGFADLVVGAEDRRFWWHPGVDPASLARALGQNQSAGGTVSGASTVTMQLARLLTPRPRTAGAKLAEAWEALQLESRLGKAGVLELYLNRVPFGRNVEGFPAAARCFFGRPLAELSPEQWMVLAVVPRNPQGYDPWVNGQNNRRAAARLYAALHPEWRGPGTPPALERAYAGLLDPGRGGQWPFRAPQFVQWLKGQPACRGLDGRRPLRTGIEPRLQAGLEDLLARTVKAAERKRVSNAAALFVRPDSMEVAAWVGSVDFGDAEHQGQIDGVRMLRQPGSTLKPFLYSLALGRGLTAASVLPDIPSDFGGAELYSPGNFNQQFNGPVRLRQALASSLNVPAVWTLEKVGVQSFSDFLVRAGFDSLAPQRGRLGLGLALGNAEVSLFELVRAYGVFAHRGELRPIRAAGAAATLDGSAPADPPRTILDAPVADLVRDILTRHPDRTLAFGRGGNTRLRFEGALKTGTSNQFNNIWAVGFTSDLLGGVWMGNFSGATVVGTADSGYPALVMRQTLEAFSAHRPFPPPAGLAQARVCSLSGGLAGPDCPYAIDEWFLPGTVPAACDWHRGGRVEYPQAYRAWLERYRYRRQGDFQAADLEVLRPLDHALYYLDPGVPAAAQEFCLEATGDGPARVYLDGQPLHSDQFPLKLWIPLEKGSHRLRVEGADRAGRPAGRDLDYEVR